MAAVEHRGPSITARSAAPGTPLSPDNALRGGKERNNLQRGACVSSCLLKGAVFLHSCCRRDLCQRGKHQQHRETSNPSHTLTTIFDSNPQPNVSSHSKARAMRARGQNIPPPPSRSKSWSRHRSTRFE